MDKRSELIRAKKAELQALLETWALSEGVVGPGEQVVFTLEVRRIPLAVVGDDPKAIAREELLDTPILRFLTRTRFKDVGAERFYVRIRTAMENATCPNPETDSWDKPIRTLRDLLTCTLPLMRSQRNMGKHSVEVLEDILAKEGLYFSGE